MNQMSLSLLDLSTTTTSRVLPGGKKKINTSVNHFYATRKYQKLNPNPFPFSVDTGRGNPAGGGGAAGGGSTDPGDVDRQERASVYVRLRGRRAHPPPRHYHAHLAA